MLLTGAIALSFAYFGEGSGTVQLNYIRCYGTEYNLTECETANNTGLISPSQEVGVMCQPGNNNTLIYRYFIPNQYCHTQRTKCCMLDMHGGM